MKQNYRLQFILVCCLTMIFSSCTRDNDIDIPQTSVNQITETSVTVGDEMTFTGTNMHLITKVTFGEIEAEVDPDLAKRDRHTLKVTVPAQTLTQKVRLFVTYNTNKTIVLSEDLEIIVPPVIPTATSMLPTTVMSGNVVEITGTDLQIIKNIQVGTADVTLRSKDERSVSFVAPEVAEEVSTTVKLIYDNSIGSNQELTVLGTLTITPAVTPKVTSSLPESALSGTEITLEGENLAIITTVNLGTLTATVQKKEANALTFLVPTVTEETTTGVTLVYNNTLGSNRELALDGTLLLKPLPVVETKILEWDNVIIGGQSTNQSFFDGTTGTIYTPCDLFDNQEKMDFMMNVNTSGENQLYNPANATSVLKNQLCDGKALGTEDGKDYSKFLAVNTKFRLLSTSNAAQGELARKVIAREIEEINDELFTGISKPSSNTPKNFVVGDVLWFYNATKDKNGLIEIKEVTAGATPQENTMKMHIYYQK
ncbi:MAG: hypothetical protein LUH22_03880 [Bacteroides sp.]|nr:hypothetical protein [Bacteroides sp.]